MRKNYFFFKSLLLATVLLLGSANAWADATLVYGRAVTADLPNGYTAWSSDDIGSGKWVASQGTASIDSANRGLKVAQQRGSARATNSSQISVTTGYIITLDAVWNTGYSSGGAGENNAFTIGNNIEIRAYTYDQHGDIYINGEFYASISNACGKSNGNRDHDPWTIHLVVNTGTNKITEFTILGANGTKKATYTLEGTISLNAGTTYNSLSLAHNRTKGNNAAEACYLTSVKITEEAQAITTADVTFKYAKTDGTSLSSYRADEVASGIAVGTDISSLVSTYATTFYNGTSNKYVYNSYSVTGDYTTVQEGGNTVTLKYTDYPSTAYTVMAQAGGSDLTSIASGTAYLDGSTTEYYSKFVYKSGKWYQTGKPYNVAVNAATINVEYTEISNVVYCKEAEDIDGLTTWQYGDYRNNMSGLSSAVLSSTDLITLDAGVYEITACAIGRADDRYVDFYKNSVDDANKILRVTSRNDGGVATSTFALTESTTIVGDGGYAGGTNGHACDYIYIKKLPDNVSITISSASGLATLYSEYALDYEHATPSGLKAYTVAVSVAEDEVTPTQVDNVPAGTGVILKGTTGTTYTIPVIASSETAKGALIGSTTPTAPDAFDGYDLYGLAAKGANQAEFRKVVDNAIPAGRAFLKLTHTNEAKVLRVVDGQASEVTAPEVVETEEPEVLFNLAGIPVGKDFKGYVINQKGEKRLQK